LGGSFFFGDGEDSKQDGKLPLSAEVIEMPLPHPKDSGK